MSPRASCQIACPTSVFRLFFIKNNVIAATVPGNITILDVICQRDNLENDPHKRTIEAGKMSDIAGYESSIVSGNEDGVVRLWCANTGYSYPNYSALKIDLAYHAVSRAMLKEYHGHGSSIKSVPIPDGLVVISAAGLEDAAIHIWDITSGQCRHILNGHTWSINSLATIGDRLFSGSSDGTVRIWDLSTGRSIYKLDGHPKYAMTLGFNDDKTLLAAACGNGDIKIWRIEDG